MKFKSAMFTQVSGSIGGMCCAHNQGGMYARARSLPTNPNTAAQIEVRDNLAYLSVAWNFDLVQADRDAWAAYAAANPITDALGEPLTLSGQQMFIRLNAARLIVPTFAAIPTPPAMNGLAPFSVPTFTANAGAPGDLEVAYDNADAWATVVGGALICYTGVAQSPGRSYYRGPWRYAGAVLGAVIPPTSPDNFAAGNGQTWAAGDTVAVKYRVVEASGRVSQFSYAKLVIA